MREREREREREKKKKRERKRERERERAIDKLLTSFLHFQTHLPHHPDSRAMKTTLQGTSPAVPRSPALRHHLTDAGGEGAS